MLKRLFVAIPLVGAVLFSTQEARADDHTPDPAKPLTSLWNDLGLEFQGYFRVGTGENVNGGRHQCYLLPGAGAKQRLGNECDSYGELNLGGIAWKGSDGAQFDFHTMLALDGSPGQSNWEPEDVTFRQGWVQGKNLISGSNMTFWAGKRYYRRENIEQMDFFYWDPSGTGGGVEDVNVRIGKLAYAYFHDSSNLNTTNSPTTLSSQIAAAGSTGSSTGQDVSEAYHDLRIYDIPVNKNGLLTAGVDIGQPGGSDTTSTGGAPNHGGFMATIQHNQKTIFADADTNKIAVQYGQGSLSQFLSSGNITDQAGQNSRYKGERIIDYYVGDLSPNWSVGIDGIVEHHAAPVQTCTEANQFNAATGAVTSCTKQTWYSASIRPLYYISDHFALQFDVGHDIVKPDGLPERDMTKFTFAPTLRTGRGWFDRPEIRAFVTYAAWNKAAREAGLVTFNSHGQMTTETAGTSFGIQTEIWW